MPRLRDVREGHVFGFGLGASVGEYFWNETVGNTAGATKLWPHAGAPGFPLLDLGVARGTPF